MLSAEERRVKDWIVCFWEIIHHSKNLLGQIREWKNAVYDKMDKADAARALESYITERFKEEVVYVKSKTGGEVYVVCRWNVQEG